MPEYGYYRKKKRDTPRMPWWGIALRILDVFMIAGTALCSTVLILAYFAKYVDPSKSTVMAFAGLVFPIVYAAMIVIGLYWLMRWRRYAAGVAAVLLLFGIGNARLFYKLSIMERYEDSVPLRSELVVMSYNVMQFGNPAGDERRSVLNIAEFVAANNIDVLCLQEFDNKPESRRVFDSVLVDLRHRYFRHYVVNNSEDNAVGLGLAIYSRYPMTGRGVIDTDTAAMRSMWADIRIKRDTVRVVNNHLQSTHINGDDVDYLSDFRLSGAQGIRHIGQIMDKLGENYILRAPQADSIAQFIARSPHPAIVCGDFNDTPVSYAYHTISRGLKDAFVEKGRGTAVTYNGFMNMFRIDYILMSEGLDISRYYPFEVVYSDHNPIAASFYFSQP